jgi:hypothetical protein
MLAPFIPGKDSKKIPEIIQKKEIKVKKEPEKKKKEPELDRA